MSDEDRSRTQIDTGDRQIRDTTTRKALTMDAIRQAYDGRWVLISVTALDELGFPLRGKVLADSADEWEINEALRQAKRGKGKRYYTYFAGPLLTSGPEFEKAIPKAIGDLRRAMAGKRASGDR